MNGNYFEPLKLRRGNGGSYENGLCVMEAVAWLNGEDATDAPKCACPALAAFAIRINDRLDDNNRQKLSRLILPLTGTRSVKHERNRADYLVIQTCKRIVPMWFERAGLDDSAGKLRQAETVQDVLDVGLSAKEAAHAADAAAYDAADAAHAAAYADAAAYAAHVAADAAGHAQPMLIASIDILDEAIKLGPNGYDEWPTYEGRASQLVEFAQTVLA